VATIVEDTSADRDTLVNDSSNLMLVVEKLPGQHLGDEASKRRGFFRPGMAAQSSIAAVPVNELH
jgi:hypothetical protein